MTRKIYALYGNSLPHKHELMRVLWTSEYKKGNAELEHEFIYSSILFHATANQMSWRINKQETKDWHGKITVGPRPQIPKTGLARRNTGMEVLDFALLVHWQRSQWGGTWRQPYSFSLGVNLPAQAQCCQEGGTWQSFSSLLFGPLSVKGCGSRKRHGLLPGTFQTLSPLLHTVILRVQSDTPFALW